MDKLRLLMEDEKKKVQLLHKTNPELGEEETELWFGEEYKCKVVEKEDMLRVKVHYKGWSAGHDDWVSLPKSLPRSQVLAQAVRKSQGGRGVAVRKDLFRDTPTETKEDKEEEGDLPSKPATKPKERARGHTLYAFYKTLEEKPWKDLAEKCLAMGLSDKGDNAQLVKRIKEAARVMSEDTLFFHISSPQK